jgi:hypothetical protein
MMRLVGGLTDRRTQEGGEYKTLSCLFPLPIIISFSEFLMMTPLVLFHMIPMYNINRTDTTRLRPRPKPKTNLFPDTIHTYTALWSTAQVQYITQDSAPLPSSLFPLPSSLSLVLLRRHKRNETNHYRPEPRPSKFTTYTTYPKTPSSTTNDQRPNDQKA